MPDPYQKHSLSAGFTLRACRSCLPWLCSGTTYMLSATLLVAVSHHHGPYSDPSVFTKSLFCFELAVYSISTILMYTNALRVWKQQPPPAWEGEPIYWRAGPEHAAACFSEWLRHLNWLILWEYYPDKPYQPSSPEVAAAIFGTAGMLLYSWCTYCNMSIKRTLLLHGAVCSMI